MKNLKQLKIGRLNKLKYCLCDKNNTCLVITEYRVQAERYYDQLCKQDIDAPEKYYIQEIA